MRPMTPPAPSQQTFFRRGFTSIPQLPRVRNVLAAELELIVERISQRDFVNYSKKTQTFLVIVEGRDGSKYCELWRGGNLPIVSRSSRSAELHLRQIP